MPKIVDHDLQRDALADACFEVFAQDGYAAASMRRLAKSAGVSTGTLYHYFPDKQAIFAHLVDLVIDRDETAIRADVPSDQDRAARLRTVIRWVGRHHGHLHRVLTIVVEVRRHGGEEGQAQVRRAVQRYRRVLADLLDTPDGPFIKALFSLFVGTLVHGDLDDTALDYEGLEALGAAFLARLPAP